MNQQSRQPTRISGTVRRGGGHAERSLPDAVQAWKGGRTLIRLVDITVRSHAAASAPAAAHMATPTTALGNEPTVPQPAASAAPSEPAPATRAAPSKPAAPTRKPATSESSLQPMVVLALIGAIFGVLAAAIVSGRSNVESTPDVGPAPAWRVAPLESSAAEAAENNSQAAAADDREPAAAADAPPPDIELPDPALSDAGREAKGGAAARHPPVARFRGHIEPDTMEARHDQPGTSIH